MQKKTKTRATVFAGRDQMRAAVQIDLFEVSKGIYYHVVATNCMARVIHITQIPSFFS
jgi:hypothetical protein